MSIHETARSLLAWFGTCAEWGERSSHGQHDPSPELRALVDAVLDIVPAAWELHKEPLGDGYVTLYQPAPEAWMGDAGFYNHCISVHGITRPPRYVEPDATTPTHTVICKAVAAALVGLASNTKGTLLEGPDLDNYEWQPRIVNGRREYVLGPKLDRCAQAIATLTDEQIGQAEQDSGDES